MPKVLEQDGLRFYVYFNDHRPSHVHIEKAGGEAIIYLGDSTTRPSLREVRGMSVRDVKKALEITAQQQKKLKDAWSRIHGKDEAE